ncbi:MAG: hypothetical protein PHE55_00865 [Methylococcaceae bacterium]|nr:hypothetical protein [Methylococcaceae bacterium]
MTLNELGIDPATVQERLTVARECLETASQQTDVSTLILEIDKAACELKELTETLRDQVFAWIGNENETTH